MHQQTISFIFSIILISHSSVRVLKLCSLTVLDMKCLFSDAVSAMTRQTVDPISCPVWSSLVLSCFVVRSQQQNILTCFILGDLVPAFWNSK